MLQGLLGKWWAGAGTGEDGVREQWEGILLVLYRLSVPEKGMLEGCGGFGCLNEGTTSLEVKGRGYQEGGQHLEGK